MKQNTEKQIRCEKEKYDVCVMDAVKIKQKYPMVNAVVVIIAARLQREKCLIF